MKLVVPLAVLTLAWPAQAATPGVSAAQAWSRPATAGATGAGFVTLANAGKAADALTGASSPLARKAEIHLSRMDGGIMRMRRQDRVAIPAGGRVAFAPGGYHLMFYGLVRPLKVGDKLPATLTFASGRSLQVSFTVRPAAPAHSH